MVNYWKKVDRPNCYLMCFSASHTEGVSVFLTVGMALSFAPEGTPSLWSGFKLMLYKTWFY